VRAATADKRFLVRHSPAEEPRIVRSDGPYLIDARGRRYIDFVAGWCVGNLGWGDRQVRAAIRGFKGPDYVHPSHLYTPWAELASLLASVAPGRLRRCIRATGGTEAVDIALQAAMLHTGRRGFVSIEGSYHGNSIATMSVASSENRERFKGLLPHCRKVSPPLDERAIPRVERLLKDRTAAAFIMEPVICNLAVLVPEPAFMTRLQALCRRYGTLLIADEVATGFGRTGRLFASEHFGLEPDILCLAKALSGGYAPIGAVMVTDRVASSLAGEYSPWSTYGWHPLSTTAAIATLRVLIRSRDRLMARVSAAGDYFRRRLLAIRLPRDARVNAKGLAIAVELGNERLAERTRDRCRERGLLVSADDDALGLFPPLNIPMATARKGLDILESAFAGL
jgi:4-aminobutyrate aminotransferase-like enzyme